ncbi:putative conserved membrane protein [Synechococcus sp. BOUM118]|nr:putative conserved membrane protein [Synechococcus sp. BOUM118]
MTNLAAGSPPSLLSRDRILLGVPLLVGALIAAGIGWFLLRPAQERFVVLETRVEELSALQRQLPLLDRQLVEANAKFAKAQQQQALLLDVIAGKDRIQTFLAMLDQVSRQTGVNIERYEPLAVKKADAAQPPARRNNKTKAPPPPTDPLLALGYRQSSVVLRVEGQYQSLQRFLQQMEALKILAESSDLNLQASGNTSETDDGSPSVASTALSIRLSFYDRAEPPQSATPAASGKVMS